MTSPATRPTTRAWLVWAVMGVVAVACLALATTRTSGPLTPEDRVNAVAKAIKCPTCQGESVADSNAPSSREIRRDIADRLMRGETGDQIRAFYADSYGEAILLTPSRSGITSLVWVLPVVAMMGAAAGLVVAFRRWKGAGDLHASDDDRVMVEQALADFESRERSR